MAVTGYSTPKSNERAKDSQSTEILPKDLLRMTIENGQMCELVRDWGCRYTPSKFPGLLTHGLCSPVLLVFICLHFSAGAAGLSMSSICRAVRAWEKRSLLTDSGKSDQSGNLCCSLCELLIQKLLSCLLATALENMAIPGVAGESVCCYNT